MPASLKTGNRTAQKLVLEKYPTAFVDDDGEWVYIMTTTIVQCRECGGTGKHTVTDFTRGALGAGGTSSSAWESAAHILGLLP